MARKGTEFHLTVHLGNDEMRTARDVGQVLRALAARLHGGEPEVGDSGVIRDTNGNRVGSWHVE